MNLKIILPMIQIFSLDKITIKLINNFIHPDRLRQQLIKQGLSYFRPHCIFALGSKQ